MNTSSCNIAVLGAGSWGTALALLLADNGHSVALWSHEHDDVKNMIADGSNERYLPGIAFPANLTPYLNLDDCVLNAELILVAVPSHAFADMLQTFLPKLTSEQKIIWATKGIDPHTHGLLHDVAQKLVGNDHFLAVLSGPSFAGEVANKLPTAVAIASSDEAYVKQLSQIFSNNYFRVYTCADYIGVGIGGAVKNVLAIATGISDGLGYGANARCALITRGLAEMMRLSAALGGKQETLMGLAGVGDLILTATDDQSRNRRFGLALGRGDNAEEAIETIGQVVEGFGTTEQIYWLAQKHHVDMPITEQIYKVLYENLPVKEAAANLLSRDPKPE